MICFFNERVDISIDGVSSVAPVVRASVRRAPTMVPED